MPLADSSVSSKILLAPFVSSFSVILIGIHMPHPGSFRQRTRVSLKWRKHTTMKVCWGKASGKTSRIEHFFLKCWRGKRDSCMERIDGFDKSLHHRASCRTAAIAFLLIFFPFFHRFIITITITRTLNWNYLPEPRLRQYLYTQNHVFTINFQWMIFFQIKILGAQLHWIIWIKYGDWGLLIYLERRIHTVYTMT